MKTPWVYLLFFVSVISVPESASGSCLSAWLNRVFGRTEVQAPLTSKPILNPETPAVSQVKDPIPVQVSHAKKIEDLDELLQGFSHGLIPDLGNSSQRNAFELYRRMRFGDPNTNLNTGTLDEIQTALKKHPELKKESFRDYTLKVQHRSYPVTKELKEYLDSQVTSSGQVRSNLYRVEANSGYWKKIFQYEEHTKPKIEPLFQNATPEEKVAYREKSKALKEEENTRWTTFLNQKMKPEPRANLVNPEKSGSEKAMELFRLLKAEREHLASQGKDLKPISQAMIDVVHTVGYQDPVILKNLKSASGMERLNAYRKILDERDRFAMDLGYDGHFDQIMQEIGHPAGVTVPTGVPSYQGTTETLQALEEGVVKGSKVVESDGSSRTIRHLSMAESPLRSCLGGSDCSSRTYLTRALDPNYHYFTLTDDSGFSSGHITIVLGDAKMNGSKVKVAFIDKVQNVSNADLPLMMEGVRRSVDEKGYKLILPDDVGDHNGLSNEAVTRGFVEKNIETDPTQKITDFKPHGHSYSFPNKYSRAENNLPSHSVSPLKVNTDVEIAQGELSQPWTAHDLNLDRLVQGSKDLKNSPSLNERLRYIPAMKAIKKAGLKMDPEFDSTLTQWMKDESQDFKIRKQAFLYEWEDNQKPLKTALSSFSKNDQAQMLQNLIDTPRYRELIFKDKNQIPDLITGVRQNSRLRENLLTVYFGNHLEKVAPLLEKILSHHDVPDEVAASLIRRIKAGMGSQDIAEFLKIGNALHETSLANVAKEELPALYVKNFTRPSKLGQSLAKVFNESADHSLAPASLDFINALISKADDPSLSQFKVLKAYKEILSRQPISEGKDGFLKSSLDWMKSEQGSPELKAEFLMSQVGSSKKPGGHLFERYQAEIPEGQRPQVMRHIQKKTNLNLVEHLPASERGAILENAKLESFEYEPHSFPEGGKRTKLGSSTTEAGRYDDEGTHEVTLTRPFEMQATPVTQLQWAMVMGENPSNFKGGKTVQIKGKDIQMNPNRPVEQVSWNDVQTYIQKLNQMDPNFHYRLPTEAEWEYAARAGTDSAYSFGNEQNELAEYAWYDKNSGSETHDVASLKPNPSGLYDMHGNVWEWTQDWYQKERPAHATDPSGPSSGSNRVLRGGSWFYDPESLRSARRYSSVAGYRGNFIGFRLVRTPK